MGRERIQDRQDEDRQDEDRQDVDRQYEIAS